MSRLRITYIALLVILTVLTVNTVFRPIITKGEYSEVQRAQLLQTEDEWIAQIDFINHEDKELNRTIAVLFEDEKYAEDFSIPEGGTFTYIHRIRRETVSNGDITFAIYKEDDTEPLKQVTYYLK